MVYYKSIFIRVLYVLVITKCVNNEKVKNNSLNVFGQSLPYVFKIAQKDEAAYQDASVLGYEIYSDVCSRFTDENKNLPRNFSATLLAYKGENSNMKFAVEITFQSSREEDKINGYEIKLTDEKLKKFQCIKVINPKKATKTTKLYKLVIMDLNAFNNANNSKYIFDFGKVTVDALKWSGNSMVSTMPQTQSSWISLEVLSENENEIDEYSKLDELDCLETIFDETCVKLYHNKENGFLVIAHPIVKHIEGYYHQFGMNKDFYAPIISYNSEAFNNIVYKIVDDVKLDHSFFYTNYFTKPSVSNPCRDMDDNHYCTCNQECIKCYSNNSVPLHVIRVQLNKPYFSNCKWSLNLSKVTFIKSVDELFIYNATIITNDYSTQNKTQCSQAYLCYLNNINLVRDLLLVVLFLITLIVIIAISVYLYKRSKARYNKVPMTDVSVKHNENA